MAIRNTRLFPDPPGGGGGGGAVNSVNGQTGDVMLGPTDVAAVPVAQGRYTNATPMPQAVGGCDAGSTFNNLWIPQVLDQLLYPYQNPAFTSFAISGQTTPVEVGTAVSGVKTFSWGTSNSANVLPNSVLIRDVTNAVVLASGLLNDGTEAVDVGSIQKLSAATHSWRAEAVNNKSLAFVSANFTVSWQWRRFYGESATTPLNAAAVQGLRASALAPGFSGTYAFLGGGYKYLAYPAALGTATSFKDQATNLDVPFEPPYLVNLTNAFGVAADYRVHRSTNILGAAINIIVS